MSKISQQVPRRILLLHVSTFCVSLAVKRAHILLLAHLHRFVRVVDHAESWIMVFAPWALRWIKIARGDRTVTLTFFAVRIVGSRVPSQKGM